jgi:hypothetical protein
MITDLYRRFNDLRKKLRPYDTKKDLLRAKPEVQKDYWKFRLLLGVTDKRFSPKRVKTEFAKFTSSALAFKSEALNYNLSMVSDFDKYDTYRSSSKLVARVTSAMVEGGVQNLQSISVQTESIDVMYKTTKQFKTVKVRIKQEFITFVKELPSDIYINVNGTIYNKNGLDFEYDYHNQSNDYVRNILPAVDDQIELSLFIFSL